jgi:RNA polymerase sigma factor (sigma-70 family)
VSPGPEREARILGLRNTVEMMARVTCRTAPSIVGRDEIVSAAWLGAIQAVDSFQPDRNTVLSTWAEMKIRSAILDYLRSLDPVGRYERKRCKQTGAEPPRTFSITRPHDRRPMQIEDRRSLKEIRAIEGRLDLAKIFNRAPSIQPRSMRMVLRHADGDRMLAIGRSEGISEGRVSQIHKDTVAKLRAAA